MKTLRLVFSLLTLCLAFGTPRITRADEPASFDLFYNALTPYGEWIEVGDYGPCWRPTVDADWAPYSDGYWAYTDAGWTWLSYEEFGGIVYHYGRWIRVEGEGWCWVPDYEWAPSWVSWRSNDTYVGWAPLPPEARWRREVGISVWVDDVCDIGPGQYNFCRVHDFGMPVMRGVIVNRAENVTIIRSTTNITNITYNTNYYGGPVIYTGGPSYAAINRVSARPIPSLKLVQNNNFDVRAWHNRPGGGAGGPLNARTVGNQLVVFAPPMAPPANPKAFHTQMKRTVDADKITKGWGVVKSPEEQQALRKEIKRQSSGFSPETSPARPVSATELKDFPEKGNPKAASVVTAAPASTPVAVAKPRGTPWTKALPIATPLAKPPASLSDTPPLISTPRQVSTPDAIARERARMRNSPSPATSFSERTTEQPFPPVFTPERKPRAQFPPTESMTPIPRRPAPSIVEQNPAVTDPGRTRRDDAMAQRQAEVAAQRDAAATARAEASNLRAQQAAQQAVRERAISMPPQPRAADPGASPAANAGRRSKGDKDRNNGN